MNGINVIRASLIGPRTQPGPVQIAKTASLAPRIHGLFEHPISMVSTTSSLPDASASLTGPYHRVIGYFWGLAAPALCTLINWPLRERISPPNILMIYLLGVFLVAIRFGRGPSILASLQCAAAFAFFFGPPIYSFAIWDTEHLIGLAVMLIVAVVTSSLMEALRFQAAVAAQREQRASTLYRLSKELAGTRQEADVIAAGIRHIHAQFALPNCVLFPDGSGRLHLPPKSVLLPQGGPDLDLATAQRVFEQGQPQSVDTTGGGADSEANALYWPLMGSEGNLGVWVLELPAGRSFSAEERTLLDLFLHQIVQSLERVRASEQARCTAIRIEAETLKNSLLSAISHDLRTPLSTIVGASGTLVEDDEHLDAEHRRKLILAIHEDAQRMSDLTHKILDMARLEAGKVALNRQWYALEEIVGSALRRMRKQLESRSVTVDLDDGLSLVYVDAALMQQVLVNLLENAVKYTPDASPLAIAAERSPKLLTLVVADRGPGIPDKFKHRIFDKFFRVHPQASQGGAGLGLAICRAIVNAHGGEIRYAARTGGGALFRLELPLTETPPDIEPENEVML